MSAVPWKIADGNATVYVRLTANAGHDRIDGVQVRAEDIAPCRRAGRHS